MKLNAKQVSKANSVIRALIRFSMAVIRYADPTMGQRKGMGERYGHWWRCGPGVGDKNAESTWRAQRQNLLRMLSILLRQQPLFDPKPSPLFDERHGNIPTATRNMAVPFYVRFGKKRSTRPANAGHTSDFLWSDLKSHSSHFLWPDQSDEILGRGYSQINDLVELFVVRPESKGVQQALIV